MLTEKHVKPLPPGYHRDSQGLYLRVAPTGTRKWVYRYRFEGKSRDIGLGGYPAVSLKTARSQRDQHLSERLQGHDPLTSNVAASANA